MASTADGWLLVWRAGDAARRYAEVDAEAHALRLFALRPASGGGGAAPVLTLLLSDAYCVLTHGGAVQRFDLAYRGGETLRLRCDDGGGGGDGGGGTSRAEWCERIGAATAREVAVQIFETEALPGRDYSAARWTTAGGRGSMRPVDVELPPGDWAWLDEWHVCPLDARELSETRWPGWNSSEEAGTRMRRWVRRRLKQSGESAMTAFEGVVDAEAEQLLEQLAAPTPAPVEAPGAPAPAAAAAPPDAARAAEAEGGGGGEGVNGAGGQGETAAAEQPGGRAPPPLHARDQLVETPEWYAQHKHVFVLSYSGKPIFTLHGDESLLSGFMGMLCGVIELVNDSSDAIQFIRTESFSMSFMMHGPMYLVMLSLRNESAWQLNRQLELFYQHTLFTATSAPSRLLERQAGRDVRHMFEGSRAVAARLVQSMDSRLTLLLGAFLCVPMEPEARVEITRALERFSQEDNQIAYAVLLSGCDVVTYLEHPSYPLDATDLLLLSEWSSTPQTRSAQGEVFDKICLPSSLDPDCFVFAYSADVGALTLVVVATVETKLPWISQTFAEFAPDLRRTAPELLRARAGASPEVPLSSQFDVATLGQSELWHFVFLSVSMNQLTAPAYADPFDTPPMQRALFRAYAEAATELHFLKSGAGTQGGGDKPASAAVMLARSVWHSGITEYYHVGAEFTILGWAAQNFTIISAFSPLVKHHRAVDISRHIVTSWLPESKRTLFLLGDRALRAGQ